MDRASTPAAPSARPAFRDGLGERRHAVDLAGNDTLEQLCLRGELASVPSFEFALRERVGRLATFRHEQFARVRSVERVSSLESMLCIVSERVNGVRLSELLSGAEHRRLGLDINAALYLIRQLIAGIAALHESAREVAHGVIGPERLVVTRDGRLVIVEYVLGSALEQLRYPRERYWSELRVALPSSAGLARLDQRADVTQVGLVALSLTLGRLLRDDEYPGRIADVLASTWAVSAKGGFEPLPGGLRTWMVRALQLDVRTGFGSAAEARAELDRVLADVADYTPSPASLDVFLARYHGVTPLPLAVPPPVIEPISRVAGAALPTALRPVTPLAPAPPVAVPPMNALAARSTPVALVETEATPPLGIRRAPIASTARSTPTPALGTRIPPASDLAPPPFAPAMRSLTPIRGTPMVASSPAVVMPFAAAPPPQSATPGHPGAAPVQIQSMAESVAVNLPTPPRGTAMPIAVRRQAMPAKSTVNEPPPIVSAFADRTGGPTFRSGEDREEARNWPKLAAMAGVLVAFLLVGGFAGWAFLRPAPIPVTDGTLVITTNPSGAQTFIDGRARGATPLTLQLPEGVHKLELRSPGGSRTIPITINAGMQVAQFIELPQTPSGAGHLQIRTEPAGVRVTVDGVARGTSPLTVSELAPGEHQVLLESDLGSVKQTILIESGATAQLLAPMTAPQGVPVSGWISVSSPLELQLFEGDRLLGSSRSDRIMVSTGRHDIELVSELYGYRGTRSVLVAAGKVVTIAAEMPSGAISLNATPWAEVWIDGARVGETPIGNHPLAIGTHEVVFRHPELGEQTHTANVTLKDVARLSVDLTKN